MQIAKELALGLGTCVLIVGLAVGSNALLDRYLAGAAKQLTAQAGAGKQNGADNQATAQSSADKQATVPGGTPCVDAKGSWKNWPWPNVPTLSPPCPVAPEPRQPTEKQ
jgi:hypothetical protein